MKTVPNPEGKNQYTEVRRQNDAEPSTGTRARDIVAKAHDVGTRTVDRAISFSKGLDAADSVSPGFKTAILTGTVKAPKSVIASLQKMDELERKKTVQAIRRASTARKAEGTRNC